MYVNIMMYLSTINLMVLDGIKINYANYDYYGLLLHNYMTTNLKRKRVNAKIVFRYLYTTVFA